jgi:hypothetical protein
VPGNSGGTNAVTGGAANTGGAISSGGTRTGGASGVTGGASGVTGGTSGMTGGASGVTGGTSGVTGGAANTGGSSTLTGGTSAGGSITGGTGPGPSYYENAPFAGYAWTASSGTGTTITPANYDDKTPPGAPFCASGSVGAMTDYSGTAMVGINLNQAAGSTVAGTWTPPSGSTGIIINVTNSGASTLRVQIQGPNGGTDANQRWCASLSQFGTDVTIPWTAFNTMCWDNTGTYYSDAMSPLEAVLVLVPGGSTAAVSYNFCVNKLALAGGGAGGTGGTGGGTCAAAGTLQPTGTLTGTGWSAVRRDGVNYIVQSNVWSGNGQQTISYNGNTFQVTQQTGSNSTSAGPVSYPSAFIGSNNSRSSSTAGLPRAVSSLGTIQTCVTHNATGSTSGTYNASFDLWFSTGSGGDSTNPSGGYVMLWLYKPSGAQPIGSIETSAASVGGLTVDVWFGTNSGTGRPCTSYVVRSTATTYSGNLAPFIQDAVTRGHVQSSWYLTNVFFGFEIWSGGVGLSLSNCSISLS